MKRRKQTAGFLFALKLPPCARLCPPPAVRLGSMKDLHEMVIKVLNRSQRSRSTAYSNDSSAYPAPDHRAKATAVRAMRKEKLSSKRLFVPSNISILLVPSITKPAVSRAKYGVDAFGFKVAPFRSRWKTSLH